MIRNSLAHYRVVLTLAALAFPVLSGCGGGSTSTDSASPSTVGASTSPVGASNSAQADSARRQSVLIQATDVPGYSHTSPPSYVRQEFGPVLALCANGNQLIREIANKGPNVAVGATYTEKPINILGGKGVASFAFQGDASSATATFRLLSSTDFWNCVADQQVQNGRAAALNYQKLGVTTLRPSDQSGLATATELIVHRETGDPSHTPFDDHADAVAIRVQNLVTLLFLDNNDGPFPDSVRAQLTSVTEQRMQAVADVKSSGGPPPNPYRPPNQDVECPIASYTASFGGSVTAFSIKLGKDFEEELSLASDNTWTLSGIQRFNIGAVASEGGRASIGGGGSPKLGGDLSFTGSFLYQKGVTARYRSLGSADEAWFDLGLYQIGQAGPLAGFFGGLPDPIQRAETSESSANGFNGEAGASLGVLNGNASLAATAGQERDKRTGELTSVYTLNSKVEAGIEGPQADAVLKVHAGDNGQPNALEIDTEALVPQGFSFSSADLLKKVADRALGVSNAVAGASGYSSSTDVVSTTIMLDMHNPGTHKIGFRFLTALERGDVNAVKTAWSQIEHQSTVYAFLNQVKFDSSGVDVAGGEGLTFGGADSTDSKDSFLITAYFQQPGSAAIPWRQCIAAAVVARHKRQRFQQGGHISS